MSIIQKIFLSRPDNVNLRYYCIGESLYLWFSQGQQKKMPIFDPLIQVQVHQLNTLMNEDPTFVTCNKM